MIDLIMAGDLAGFQKFLLVACGVVMASALLYFIDTLVQKRFQVCYEQELLNDLYDGVMRQSIVRFSEKDTSEHMSYIKSHASTIANNLACPILILIGYGLMGIVAICVMLYYSPLIALISVVCAIFSTIPPFFLIGNWVII